MYLGRWDLERPATRLSYRAIGVLGIGSANTSTTQLLSAHPPSKRVVSLVG